MKRSVTFFIACLFIAVSCNQPHEKKAARQSDATDARAAGRVVSVDSISEPHAQPLGNPVEIRASKTAVSPANTNIRILRSADVFAAGIPSVQIPGKDTFLLPEKHHVKDSMVIAGIPQVVNAKDPAVKDINPSSVSTFGKLQGLVSPDLTCIMQDRMGNLWLGTNGYGATKFDGKRFTYYKQKEGLSDFIQVIFEDSSGNLWFGSMTNGLIRYDGKKFTHYSAREGLSSDNVYSIGEDEQGNIWVGTMGNGVCRLDRDRRSISIFTVKQGLSGNYVLSIKNDSRGNLWFGTDRGFCKYDGKQFTVFSRRNGLASEVVRCLSPASGGGIWIGTEGAGVYLLSGDEKSISHISRRNGLGSDSVICMIPGKGGDLFVGTDGGGISIISPDLKTVEQITEKEGLCYNVVACMLEDRAGNFWFSSSYRGLSRYNGKLFSHYTTAEGLSNSYIWSLFIDSRKNLWVGTDRDISVLSSDKKKFTYFNQAAGLSNNNYVDVFEDRKGNLWFIAWGYTIIKFDGRKYYYYGPVHGLDAQFYSIMQDRSGNLWIGSNKGVYKISEDCKSFTRYSSQNGLTDNDVAVIFEDSRSNIWFGGGKGITRYDGRTFVQFGRKEGLVHEHVVAIAEDSKGDLWFSTWGGLSRFNGALFVNYDERDGLANDRINSMIFDHHGNLWLGTRNGLSKLPKACITGERPVFFRNFTYEDGFLGIGVYFHGLKEDADGTIWIAATDRLTAYHPGGDFSDTLSPCLQLTNIRIYNENIPWRVFEKMKDTTLVLSNGIGLGNLSFDSLSPWFSLPENLSLDYKNNYLTFEFIGITQKQPQKVKYQYKLQGFDENWSPVTGNTEAPYGNLPHGTYTFKVRSMSSDGYWSKEAEYTFTIRPPWYQTLVFRMLLVIFVIFSLFAMYRWRTASLRRRHKELEMTVRSRTAEIVKKKEELEATLEKLRQTQSQLIQSEKMASLGMLTAGIAHEINNPINFINAGAISLQQDFEDLQKFIRTAGLPGEESRKLAEELSLEDLMKIIPQTIEDIKTGVFRTTEIVKGLRNFSRLDATEMKEADIHETLESTLLLLNSRIKNRIFIVKNFDRAIKPVRCFPGPLGQVFMNLLNNAIDAVEQKRIADQKRDASAEVKYHIFIDTKLDGKNLFIKIADEGSGIRDEIKEKIFDPFFTTKDVGKGTGLGLSICHGIIEKHGGSISLESSIGKGTVFTISLPV